MQIAGLVVVGMLLIAASGGPAPADVAACQVVLDYMQSGQVHVATGTALAVSSQSADDPPPFTADQLEAANWYVDHQAGTSPEPDLVARYRRTADRDALKACPNLRAKLTEDHIPFGDAIDRKLVVNNRDEFNLSILSLALPVVSPDGREALMNMETGYGPLAGASAILHFRRNAQGRWVVIGHMITGIS